MNPENLNINIIIDRLKHFSRRLKRKGIEEKTKKPLNFREIGFPYIKLPVIIVWVLREYPFLI